MHLFNISLFGLFRWKLRHIVHRSLISHHWFAFFQVNMSTKTSSTYLQPPAPPGVSQQTNQQPDQQQSVARLHSVAAHSSTASTSNIFHSLSSIHRSNSILPAPPLDIDLASTAGLQVSSIQSLKGHDLMNARLQSMTDFGLGYPGDHDPVRASTLRHNMHIF